MRFEQSVHGELIVAALCLLEASISGLLEPELLMILADETQLAPPSPFEEKGVFYRNEITISQGSHSSGKSGNFRN